MCANDPADCASGCISIGTIDTTCLDSYQAWLTCAANATFTCNGSGQAEPAGCDSEEGDFTTCLEGI
jgi:hypothetical protein